MHLEIADAVLQQAHLTAAEVKLELAVLLWQRGGLTETGAALLAGQPRYLWWKTSRRRKITQMARRIFPTICSHGKTKPPVVRLPSPLTRVLKSMNCSNGWSFDNLNQGKKPMNRKIFLLAAWLAASPLVFADFTQQLQNAGVSRAGIALLEKNGFAGEDKLKTLTQHKLLLDMGMHTKDALAVVQLARQLNQAAPLPEGKTSATADKTFKNSIGMEFVLIPAGEFLMGTDCIPEATPDCQENETLQHKVTIAEPFYLGKYEVTQAQWYKVMRTSPAYFTAEKAGDDTRNHPVEQITWQDAQAFVQKLNEKENCKDCYRLPTEAEWEYAARAGTTTAYHFGDNPADLGKYAWFNENAEGKTHPVGKKAPNQWGLHDMAGNVWEWVSSAYRPYPYRADDGRERADPGPVRATRGGGHDSGPMEITTTQRGAGLSRNPNSGHHNIGFRCAK